MKHINIIFSSPPGPEGPQFVEVENESGESISSEWIKREDGYWVLRIALRPKLPEEITAFSPRQHEILELLCQGLSNREIARAIGAAEKTVKAHITLIFSKLKVHSRTQAMRKCLEERKLS